MDRITGDTPISSLAHSDTDELYHWLKKGEEADNHKYTSREWKNGKWVYTYGDASTKSANKTSFGNAVDKFKSKVQDAFKSKKVDAVTEASPKATAKQTFQSTVNSVKKNVEDAAKRAETNAKQTVDKTIDVALTRANQASSKVDNVVSEAKKALSKWYDSPDNIYDVTRANYTEKLNAIKETDEWKAITSDKYSEYAKRDENGNVTYDIDEYLVDKKHPVLDAIGDIVSGRSVSTLEITRDTAVAGLKDYATTALEIGMLAVSFATNGLSKKFKFSQGSYDDDIEQAIDTVTKGAEYVSDIYDISSEYVDSAGKLASDMQNVNEDDVVKTASKVVSGLAKNVDEDALKSVASSTITSMYPNLDEKSVDTIVNTVMSGLATVNEVATEVAKSDSNSVESSVRAVVKSLSDKVDMNALSSLASETISQMYPDADPKEIEAMVNKVAREASNAKDGGLSNTVSSVVSSLAENVDPAMVGSLASNTITNLYPNADPKEIEAMVNDAVATLRTEETKANIESLVDMASASAKTAKEINDGDIIAAAQTILESDAIKEQVGQDAYWEQAEQILTNMSDEEIRLVNLLVKQMREGGK